MVNTLSIVYIAQCVYLLQFHTPVPSLSSGIQYMYTSCLREIVQHNMVSDKRIDSCFQTVIKGAYGVCKNLCWETNDHTYSYMVVAQSAYKTSQIMLITHVKL